MLRAFFTVVNRAQMSEARSDITAWRILASREVTRRCSKLVTSFVEEWSRVENFEHLEPSSRAIFNTN